MPNIHKKQQFAYCFLCFRKKLHNMSKVLSSHYDASMIVSGCIVSPSYAEGSHLSPSGFSVSLCT